MESRVPKLSRKQIQEETIALLQAQPGGVRWSDVLKRLIEDNWDTPANSI